MEQEKKRRRMAGLALRATARLMETPGPNRLLYTVATRQLGLDALHEAKIPAEVVPFRFLHLGAVKQRGQS